MGFRGLNHLSLSVSNLYRSERFDELNTGLDHVGLAAESREELEEWVTRFEDMDVTYTPIRDMPFGHHLNFRDPDGIPLEFHVPNAIALEGYAEIRDRDVPREELDRRIRATLEAADVGEAES